MANPAWFDYTTYMTNKLAQLVKTDPEGNWNMTKLVTEFAKAGFIGEEGAYNHFTMHGAGEDVAPNALFSANEYYAAKAAQFYGVETSAVTELQIANVKVLIEKAGYNAWTHYDAFGSNEGVNPSNSFDADAYIAAKAAAMGEGWDATKVAEAFKANGFTALEHFLTFGGKGAGEISAEQVAAGFPVADDNKVPSGEVGSVFTLTAGSDTATASIFNGNLVYNQNTDREVQTFNSGDKLTGTASTSDELNAVLNGVTGAGADLVIGATVADIETINLDVRAAGAGLDMAHVTGAKNVNFDMRAAAVLNNVNATAAPEIGLSGNAVLTVTASTLAGTADALTVAVAGAARGAGLTVAGTVVGALETLNLESAGTAKNFLTLATATTETITKTVVTGASDLDLSVGNALISGQTLDASGHDGAMNLFVDRNGITVATTNLTNVTGVETVTFVDSVAGGDAVVATNIASGTDVVLTYSTAGASSLSVKGAAANTADVLNVTIDNAAATTNTAIATSLTIADVETINFLSNGAATDGANSIAGLTVKSGATLNVSGDSALQLGLAGASTVENVTLSGAANHTFDFAATATYAEGKNLTINAAEATGNLRIDGSDFTGTVGGGAEKLTITTGSGNDTITVTANANATNVINAGAGNDTVNVGAGARGTITLGAGSDTVAFGGVNAANALTVTDFALGTGGDKISADVAAAMTFHGVAAAAADNTLTVINAAAADNTAIATLLNATAAEAAILVLNSTSGVAELWYDADGNAGGEILLASFDNITTIGSLTQFTADNFGTWA